jgi:hypothetical protein
LQPISPAKLGSDTVQMAWAGDVLALALQPATLAFVTANGVGLALAFCFGSLSTRTYLAMAAKLPVPFSDLVDCIVFGSTLLNVLLDVPDLFGLSWYQALIMLLVSSTYYYDIGTWLLTPRGFHPRAQTSEFSLSSLVHHLAGSIGIWLMLVKGIGGGLLMRLLLDTVTNLVYDLERFCNGHRWCPKISSHHWDMIFWFCFLLARCIWYPLILVCGLFELWNQTPFHPQLFVMILCWTVFSTGVHLADFFTDGIDVFFRLPHDKQS